MEINNFNLKENGKNNFNNKEHPQDLVKLQQKL